MRRLRRDQESEQLHIIESITTGNDVVTHCSIHDLLYEIIVAKSENNNVVSFVGDQSHKIISVKARHVVIQAGLEENNSALGNTKLSNIRSITVFGNRGGSVGYHKMRLLRVLDLEGTMGLKNQDIRKIGKLHNLKYLGLRGTTITKLPNSVEKLYDLETLDIRDTWVLDLPSGIVKLHKLGYLRAGFDGHGQWTNFGSFGLKAPRGMRKLRSLRNFGTVDIGQSMASAKELKYLSNLTKIAIVGFSEKNGKVLGEAIEELIHLKSLVLAASDRLGLDCCLESINIPPKYLQRLKLFSPIDKLPSWFSSLNNLVKLYFRKSGIKMEDIKVIGFLRNLKILSLLEDSFEGEQLCFGPNSFPKLQVMFLGCTRNLYDIQESLKVLVERDALERLVHLTLHDKEDSILSWESLMQKTESDFLVPRWEFAGLENLISLEEVVLDNLNVEVVKSVKDMILRNPNHPDVKCLNIPTEAEKSN